MLKTRKTIILREPLVKMFGIADPGIWVAGQEVDMGLESLKEKYVSRWRAAGYSEGLIRMALDLAEEWTRSLAEAYFPGDPEMQKIFARRNYEKGLKTADRWIRKIGEAVKATKAGVAS